MKDAWETEMPLEVAEMLTHLMSAIRNAKTLGSEEVQSRVDQQYADGMEAMYRERVEIDMAYATFFRLLRLKYGNDVRFKFDLHRNPMILLP